MHCNAARTSSCNSLSFVAQARNILRLAERTPDMTKLIMFSINVLKGCLFIFPKLDFSRADAGDFPRGSDARVRKWFKRKWLLPRFTSTGHCVLLCYTYLVLHAPIIVLRCHCITLYYALYCSRGGHYRFHRGY